jgi:hypothetical protein
MSPSILRFFSRLCFVAFTGPLGLVTGALEKGKASVFFFKKKNQKTFANWGSLCPERPRLEQS